MYQAGIKVKVLPLNWLLAKIFFDMEMDADH